MQVLSEFVNRISNARQRTNYLEHDHAVLDNTCIYFIFPLKPKSFCLFYNFTVSLWQYVDYKVQEVIESSYACSKRGRHSNNNNNNCNSSMLFFFSFYFRIAQGFFFLFLSFYKVKNKASEDLKYYTNSYYYRTYLNWLS